MRNRKSRVLKAMGFSSLALLMGAAGVFTFAPLGANPNALATASETEYTTEQGLITPKADDPTLYTTESGLDIKFGLAMPTINASLSSGNLTGFPYFTTTSGSETYTWVIIGRNSDVAMLSGGMVPYLYSQWKVASSVSAANAQYYFSNVDTTTPAGALIDTQASSKAYVYDKGIDSSITVNDTEIPSGCVLALLNSYLDSTAFYITSGGPQKNAQNPSDVFQDVDLDPENQSPAVRYGSWCRPWAYCYGYTINDTFGFGSYLNKLQLPTLQQRGYTYIQGTTTNTATLLKFFPLGGSNYTSENFKWENYLTANQYKSSVNVWGRSMYNYYSPYYTNTNGTVSYFSTCASTAYLRPACVLSLV